MCIFVIYKCLSWDSDQQQDLGKPSQKKIAMPNYRWKAAKLYYIVGEKTQCALRREQGWTHLLQCCQRLATQVCMKQSVI
jgi:hypothetical protein